MDIVVRSDEDVCHGGRRVACGFVAGLHNHIGYWVSIHIVFHTRNQQQAC